MRNIQHYYALIALFSLSACGHLNTPSMMNTAKPQVIPGTMLQQIPVATATDDYLYKIADDYGRYGSSTIKLSLAYDPSSKTYTAMNAFTDLGRIKSGLQKLGVRSVMGETVKVEGSSPTLMITYDSLTATGPDGCRNMPGFDDGLTTREIGDYKFGCSVDTMLAKQLYRPADLYGNGSADPNDGRRAANSVEYYRTVDQDEAEGALDRIGRTDINAQ